MSEFKGTKGKWKKTNRVFVLSENGKQVCSTTDFFIKEQNEYDALLISKAPEMLTMLKRLRMDYEMIIPYFPRRNEIGNEIEQLIKEATTL